MPESEWRRERKGKGNRAIAPLAGGKQWKEGNVEEGRTQTSATTSLHGSHRVTINGGGNLGNTSRSDLSRGNRQPKQRRR